TIFYKTRYSILNLSHCVSFIFFFFFNDTATTEIYTLSLHDALPILSMVQLMAVFISMRCTLCGHFLQVGKECDRKSGSAGKECRSEERFSRNAETDLVCRLLLEKKNHRLEAFSDRTATGIHIEFRMS